MITWDVEVIKEGIFEVCLYYTCPAKDVGSIFELSLGNESLKGKISEVHDPPLAGMENDRFPRGESYVKNFRKLNAGQIHLTKGKGKLTLKAVEIPGDEAMDFRLLLLNRVDKIKLKYPN